MTTRPGRRPSRAKFSRSCPAQKVYVKPPPFASGDAANAAQTIAALIADEGPPFETALVIGTDTRAFARVLARYRPALKLEQKTVTLEDPEAATHLPYPDQRYDLVMALDVIADLPRDVRPRFFRELFRIAGREVICAAPLGTDLQLLIDRSLINLCRERFRSVHTEFARRVDYGLPTPQEAFSWIRHGEEADIFYAGDVLAYQHAAEQSILRASQGMVVSVLWRWTHHSTFPDNSSLNEPETVPRRRHRRLFLHIRRI